MYLGCKRLRARAYVRVPSLFSLAGVAAVAIASCLCSALSAWKAERVAVCVVLLRCVHVRLLGECVVSRSLARHYAQERLTASGKGASERTKLERPERTTERSEGNACWRTAPVRLRGCAQHAFQERSVV